MTDPSKILAAAKAYRSAMEDPNADGEQTAMLAQRLLSAAEGVEDLGDDDRDRRIATEARDLHAKITQVIVPALDQIAEALAALAERGDAPTFKVGDRVRIARKAERFADGSDADWDATFMDSTIGLSGAIDEIDGPRIYVKLQDGCEWFYAAGALDMLPPQG